MNIIKTYGIDMEKTNKKPCKTCGKMFLPKRPNNVYHARRCFKLADYQRHKAAVKNKFPIFSCPTCKNVICLDFHPIKRADLWLKFKCPHCNVLMINVVDILKTADERLL